jgi:hypothetical protein
MSPEQLVEGRDYTIERGLFVFTADYLRRRGYCCQSGCRHCPYGYVKDSPASDAPPHHPPQPNR